MKYCIILILILLNTKVFAVENYTIVDANLYDVTHHLMVPTAYKEKFLPDKFKKRKLDGKINTICYKLEQLGYRRLIRQLESIREEFSYSDHEILWLLNKALSQFCLDDNHKNFLLWHLCDHMFYKTAIAINERVTFLVAYTHQPDDCYYIDDGFYYYIENFGEFYVPEKEVHFFPVELPGRFIDNSEELKINKIYK